jgi:hypothetical protein
MSTAPEPDIVRKSVFDHNVIGGPKAHMGSGQPHFSEGRAIKAWPYRTGDELIGYTLNEYTHTKTRQRLFHNGTDIQNAGTHAWSFKGGEYRYMGKFTNKQEALRRIEAAHRARSSVQPVAPPSVSVSPPPRTRVRPVAPTA